MTARVASWFRAGAVALAFALVALRAPSLAAADYRVAVPSVLLEAFVEPDGTVTLDYTFKLVSEIGAKRLDGVDVGMPTTSWSLSNARAWLDGTELGGLQKSPYIDNGIAANFPNGGLTPGVEATARVVVTGVGGLLFSDTTDKDLVSLRLTPTWFASQFIRGTSFVRVAIHLPPGVDAGALRWHAVKWVGQANIGDAPGRPAHAVVVFERTYAFTGPWMLGVSFPRYTVSASGTQTAVVAGVRDITTWDLFVAWAETGKARTRGLFLLLAGFTIVFFWATRRTGCVLWAVASIVLLIASAAKPVLPWLLLPLLPLFAFLVAWSRKRKKSPYVPAVASVEGGGIKRGLTAPEAACLLEAPPGKILLLVLYGLARKGFIETSPLGDGPLMARATAGFGESRRNDIKLAAEKGSVLQPYESAFLSVLKSETLANVALLEWKTALEGLAKHAASRLQGHDLHQTREYYKSIVSRAWREAASIGDVELRKQATDRTFDWMVLDGNAWRRMDSWHRAGYRFGTPWGRTPVPVGLPGSGPPPLPAPSAGDVAGSFGGRLENLAGSFATALGVGTKPAGVFASVDKVSAKAFSDFLTEMSKASSGGGGGGGTSCACACAGCACACACAGGGR